MPLPQGKSADDADGWAYNVFKLPRRPSQATLSQILKQKKHLESPPAELLATKTRRQVRLPELDYVLASRVAWWEENDPRHQVSSLVLLLKMVSFNSLAPLSINIWPPRITIQCGEDRGQHLYVEPLCPSSGAHILSVLGMYY
ncbi:unnamed protein product [Phytophthora fragariaefolia]|uniref:Unnamed protein product n=1 Tax=Phytophthora fragariaefolia TaxID=1490495 RepID=A0A9W7D3V0_9STRA|nr:unnamed protein product [Phytophthora fragariaefolia]